MPLPVRPVRAGAVLVLRARRDAVPDAAGALSGA